jgi:hypothetical protein
MIEIHMYNKKNREAACGFFFEKRALSSAAMGMSRVVKILQQYFREEESCRLPFVLCDEVYISRFSSSKAAQRRLP